MPPANQNFDLPSIHHNSNDRQMIKRRSFFKVGEIETLATLSKRRKLRRQTISSSRIFRWTTAIFGLFVLLMLHGYRQLLGWASNEGTRDLIRTSDSHASPPKFSGEPRIVHIIHTRFMQNQPDLLDLGLARLEMLEAFCINSLRQQTSDNFLWVIRTDPKLNATIREPLLEALKGIDHHLLVASNDDPKAQVGEVGVLAHLDPSSVWSGDLEWAKNYIGLAANPDTALPVLESRIDADDGLNSEFVAYTQKKGLVALVSKHPFWRIWCAKQNMEWQYETAWAAWESDPSEPSRGQLVTLGTIYCLSAGLTVGYTAGIHSKDLPHARHDVLHKKIAHCNDKSSESDDDGSPQSHCLDSINVFPVALRARTPTSAGMLRVLSNATKVNNKYVEGAKKQRVQQNMLWLLAKDKFGFEKITAENLHTYLEVNTRKIAADNLRGQCSPGHSCKIGAREALQAIIQDARTPE